MSQHKEPEKHERKEKDAPEPREVYPPDQTDPFPTEKAVVFGDASATYGSMVAPEVIRRAEQLPVTGPLKKAEEATEGELKEELKHREEHEYKKGHR